MDRITYLKSKKYLTLKEFDEVLGFIPEEIKQSENEARYLITLYKLRAARRKAKITQEELAKKSGVPRPTITKIESGRRNVTIETLMKLANALGKKLEISLT